LKTLKTVLTVMVVVSVLLFVTAVSAQEAEEPVGEVIAVRGEAGIFRAGTTIAAALHSPILLGDEIRTGSDGRVKILFNDDSLVTVGIRSSAKIAEYVEEAEGKKGKSLFDLLGGTVRSIVGRNGLSVRTPTALAAARGTDFFVRANTDLTEVAVTEDTVWVRNVDPAVAGELEVTAGYFIRVFAGKKPLDPERFTRDLLDGLRRDTDVASISRSESRFMGKSAKDGPGAMNKMRKGFLKDRLSPDIQREPGTRVPVQVNIDLPER